MSWKSEEPIHIRIQSIYIPSKDLSLYGSREQTSSTRKKFMKNENLFWTLKTNQAPSFPYSQ